MPRTGFSKNQHFVIKLDEDKTYQSGDTISGTIKFQPAHPFAEAYVKTIDLKLWGRSKTKLVRSNGQHKSIYRGRALFLDSVVQVSQVDVTDATSNVTQIWRFSTIIPDAVNFRGGDDWEQEHPFVSNRGGTSKHPLPTAFYYKGKSGFSRTDREAYIEYVLSANVSIARSSDSGTISRFTATVPLVIRASGTEEPVTDFKLNARTSMVLVKTLQLLPEKQDTNLTFRERMRTTFQSSKIPQFACNFLVQYPTVIQLHNPKLPFILRLEPRTDERFTTIPPSDYPSVQLKSFSLALESNTNIRTQGSFSTHSSEKSNKYVLYDSEWRTTGRRELAVTLSPDPTQPFDLGAHLGLSVQRTHANIDTNANVAYSNSPSSSRSSSPPPYSEIKYTNPYPNPAPGSSLPSYASQTSGHFKRELYPSFATYNIVHTHKLAWKIKIDIIGTKESRTIQGEAPVKLLSECEDELKRRDGRFDGQGVGRNHDDLELGVEAGLHAVGQVLQAIGG